MLTVIRPVVWKFQIMQCQGNGVENTILTLTQLLFKYFLILICSGASQETLSQSVGSSRANSLNRPMSPSPSVASDKNNGGDFHVS